MRFLRHAAPWLLLLASACFGQRYPILPVPNSPHDIYVMKQDSKSRLWLGTINDVYCFDGVNFYSLRQYGFPNETPNAIGEDSDGGIWIATQGTDANGGTLRGGLYRYQAGHVEKMLSGDGLGVLGVAPGVVVAAMGTEVNQAPAYGDLYRITKTGKTWTAEKLADKAANHLTLDHQQNTLFPCPGGWCELSPSQIVHWNGASSITRHPGDPLSERVLRDKYGCIWSRAEIRASYQCPEDSQPIAISSHYSQIDSTAHLEEASDGSIFMLVALTLGRPGAFQMTGANGELPNGMESATIAQDGTIWLGTSHGLYRFMYPFRLESWPQETRLPEMGTFIRRVGDRIFSTSSMSGLVVLDKDRRHWSAVPDSATFGRGEDVAGLPNGDLVDATGDMTAVIHPSGQLVSRIVDGQWGFRLTYTADGQLWEGRQDGISRVSFRNHRLVIAPEPVAHGPAVDIQYDREHDTLWACDGKSVIYRSNGVWTSLTAANGLLDLRCNSLALLPNHTLWLAYGSPAYSVIHDPASGQRRITNVSNDLNTVTPSAGIRFFVADSQGRLWRALNALDVASPDNAEANRWLRLDERDGISPLALQGHPFYADNDGSVWFSTENGITHFSPPADFATKFPVPPVFVSGVSAGSSSPALVDTLQTLPRRQNITVHLGSLQFDRRNALRFRYRLLPSQKEWATSSSPALNLKMPGWGKHTIEVQGQMLNGPWSPTASATFTIATPVWLRWPVLGGSIAFSGLVLVGGRKWQRERRKRSKRAFPELGALRMAALLPEVHSLDGALLDGRFEVGHVLARGGFATVLEGRDLQQDGLACAIKIFRQELREKDWMARRFRQEVLALATIRHPHVVRIYGHGTTPLESPYLVMEYIDGQTLRARLDESSLPAVQTALYLRQIGSALDALHALDVCHRDLKPENLMIRNRLENANDPGAIVLIDFSIAIVKDPDETLHGLSRAAGTIYYMAPEQAIGYADASTDIYSLAKIVIEMLTGQRLSFLLPDASMDLPARVRELLSQLPMTFSSPSIELLSSALEFDPSRRPKSAGRFADRIASDLDGMGMT